MFRRFTSSSITRKASSATSVSPLSIQLFTSSASITTSDLVTQLKDFQSEFAVNKNPVVKRDAADLIEREVLTDLVKKQQASKQKTDDEDDDENSLNKLAANASPLLAPPPHFEAESVKCILTSASTFSVNLLEPCHAVSAALRWCVELPRIEASLSEEERNELCVDENKKFLLDAASSAKILQSLIAMQHPHVMEVLVSWTHRVIDLLPSADAPSVVSLAHAYGRTGTIHQRLLAALETRALEVLAKTQLIAQIANSFYAFAQLKSKNEELFSLLSQRAVDLMQQASPIVIATIIDSVATSGIPQPELIDMYERLGATKIKEASAPLVASMIYGAVRCHNPEPRSEEGAKKAAESPLVEGGLARIGEIADSFDAASASKVLQSFVIANIIDENILTQLADRITSVASTCKLEECASILKSIAQFELYDDALFEALARRTMMLVRGLKNSNNNTNNRRQRHQQNQQEVNAAADQVASILCSFAMVSQPHSDLFSACQNVVKFRANQLTSSELTDLMWSYVVLGEHLRHEPLFLGMQEELRRRENTANEFEKNLIKSHARYETAMQKIV